MNASRDPITSRRSTFSAPIKARTRDYYCLEDAEGGRYWVFREGLYGREYAGGADERAPTWWMHGVLA